LSLYTQQAIRFPITARTDLGRPVDALVTAIANPKPLCLKYAAHSRESRPTFCFVVAQWNRFRKLFCAEQKLLVDIVSADTLHFVSGHVTILVLFRQKFLLK